jgi:pentatricopeptide repeat protein
MRDESNDEISKPNIISYSTVMNGWAQKGNHERASEVLRLMYDDYVKGNPNAKPDIMAYNTLLTAHLRSKDKASWMHAAALVEHMKKISNEGVLDVQPDVYSMSTGTYFMGVYDHF